MHSQTLSVALFAASVAAHGRVTSPTPRSPGDAFKAACGQQVYNNQASDPNGNIQAMAQVGATQSDFNAAECQLPLCKAFKYDDNTANVQTYSPGQTIDFKVIIAAPHTGTANVSVVNTQTNTMISDPLIYWDVYASTATGIAANNTAFSVTLPDSLPGCDQAGVCVLQWWWDARSIDQTYMSCVDFVTGSGTGSSGNLSASAGASTSTVAQATSSSISAVTNVAAVTSSTAATEQPTTLQTVTSSAAAATNSDGSSCGKAKRAKRV